MIQPLFEHRRRFAGYATRLLELEGTGTPIVLFHGYADSADTWRRTLALLARGGRRALAVDLPGFGPADRLSSEGKRQLHVEAGHRRAQQHARHRSRQREQRIAAPSGSSARYPVPGSS